MAGAATTEKMQPGVAELLGYEQAFTRPVPVLYRKAVFTTLTNARGGQHAQAGEYVVRFGDLILVLTKEQFQSLIEVPVGEQLSMMDFANACDGVVDSHPVQRIVDRDIARRAIVNIEPGDQ